MTEQHLGDQITSIQ